MADGAIRTLVSQGLAALKAGSQVAAKATSEIRNDARHPDLRAALEQGNRTSQEWAQRIDRAADEIGGIEQIENPILEAHYEVSRKIRQETQDDQSRDLGIIASGQLALHYWIAAFGTLKTYAAKVGLTQTAQEMEASVEDARQADQRHTELAQAIMSGNA